MKDAPTFFKKAGSPPPPPPEYGPHSTQQRPGRALLPDPIQRLLGHIVECLTPVLYYLKCQSCPPPQPPCDPPPSLTFCCG